MNRKHLRIHASLVDLGERILKNYGLFGVDIYSIASFAQTFFYAHYKESFSPYTTNKYLLDIDISCYFWYKYQ